MRTIPILIAAAGLTLAAAAQAAAPPPASPPLLKQALPDMPGEQVVVVRLKLPPAGAAAHPHRHPGSVVVYITEGTARLGVEGQPVQVVHAGETFFEPPGALHTVAESASATEPASAIAIMIVPDGAPLVLPPDDHSAHH